MTSDIDGDCFLGPAGQRGIQDQVPDNLIEDGWFARYPEVPLDVKQDLVAQRLLQPVQAVLQTTPYAEGPFSARGDGLVMSHATADFRGPVAGLFHVVESGLKFGAAWMVAQSFHSHPEAGDAIAKAMRQALAKAL